MDDARRPQDRLDIMALLEQADATELARTREATKLIQQRGFDRGHDLVARLEAMLLLRDSSGDDQAHRA